MLNEADLKKLTLASAARFIRGKEIKPVELTEAVLERIARLNNKMRAFITVMADRALERAHKAEKELLGGEKTGCLHGVPISLKDLYDTKGVRTTAGSKVFANRVPDEDGFVVQNVQNAGAVILGKNNLHEFAYGVT